MSAPALLREIAATYKKFGWTLRRALLTDAANAELIAVLNETAPPVEIKKADFNAVWFSRFANGRETWELRLLSANPFALCQSFDARTPEPEREDVRRAIEEKIKHSKFQISN